MRLFAAFFTVLAIVGFLRVGYGRSLSSVQTAVLSLAKAWADRNADPAVKRAQLEAVSAAISEATKNPNERALLITIGWHESAFAIHIGENRCAPHECDRGKADPIRATLAAYASGRSCSAKLPDIEKRMATFERVRRRL